MPRARRDDRDPLAMCMSHDGRVFCGEAGWERKRVEYTLAGAKVNLAARLMQAVAQAEAAARACDENALALAVEMSLAEERNVAE